MTRKSLTYLSILLLAGMALAEETGFVAIPAMKPPELDGVIAAGEWDSAATGSFREINKWDVPAQPTTWYAGCDRDNLYFAFHCTESDVPSMHKQYAHAEERDSSLFTDDCLEIFLEPYGSEKSGIFHFAVNANGIIYDAYDGDISFQSGIKVACKVESESWTMEAQIPLMDLGVTPKGAELLRINLGRERQGAPKPEYSCLGQGTGGFANQDRLVLCRPMPYGNELPPVTFLALGAPLRPEMRFTNTDKDDQKTYRVAVEAFDKDNNKLRDFEATTSPGQETKLAYRANGMGAVASCKYSVFAAGETNKPLYSNMFAFPGSAKEKRLLAMKIDRPLFQELLSEEYPPQRDFHGFQWIFGAGNAGNMQLFALQNALPYSNYDIAREHKDTGMANYANVHMINWLNEQLYCQELGTPIASMPRVLGKDIKSGLSFHLVIIPEIRELWLKDVKTIAESGARLLVWGDEIAEVLESQLISEFQRVPDNQALQELDAKIKAKYGQGKYGILKSVEEKDPLAWIAFRRTLNDELVSLFREAYQLAKSINPDIIVVSDDSVGNEHKMYAFSDWQGTFDIVTQQLYPRSDPNVDSFGFITRYLATLTGAREVWPCPHVEEYGASFTPQEVLYKLSAAVRSGATGFHYYLHDTKGTHNYKKYLCHERWGAPDRYAVEIGAQKLLARMPRLAFPPYDTAVFTATDSLRAIPGLMFRQRAEQDTCLHGFLAYGAGVSYRFLNELTLDNLAPYKLIVTVENTYVSREALDALKEYVRGGGNLLVLNPNAFASTPEGLDQSAPAQALLGAKATCFSDAPLHFTYGGQKVPVSAIRCAKLEPLPGAKVLAVFANGDPALVEMAHGQGKVFTLAANPCVSKLANHPDWKKFFLAFCADRGSRTQCDFWRFQLPDSLLPKPEHFQGKCLTNNFVKWEHFTPTTPCDDEVNGSYVLEPEPNHSPDIRSGQIPFSEGKLTDRPRAVMAPSACKNQSSWRDWAVSWKDIPGPVSIKCNWSAPRAIRQVRLFVTDTWLDAKLTISGQSFDFPCPEDFNKDPISVREVTLDLPAPVQATSLDIIIGNDSDKMRLTIAEMEIWTE